MKKTKLYKYIGYNGTITSPILLENIPSKEYYRIEASYKKLLTNEDKVVKSIIIEAEDLVNWKEIDDIGQN